MINKSDAKKLSNALAGREPDDHHSLEYFTWTMDCDAVAGVIFNGSTDEDEDHRMRFVLSCMKSV
jgi:hypothetical protein